jgi:5-methylcytosine-specific restriction endonuclease McrBC GTP-binding regulatory subunit McrB
MQYPVTIDGVEQQHLTIPDNLYLIGTMNSTDRSLAMIDYALRRRFYFWRLMPTEGNRAPVLERWLQAREEIEAADRQHLVNAFVALNNSIAQLLGPDYQIGHSYFMLNDGQIGDPVALGQVWRHAIEPLLREYFHTRHDADQHIAQLRSLFIETAPRDESIALDEIDL